MTTIDRARERMTEAYKAFHEIEEVAVRAEAEYARLILLNLTIKNPTLEGLSFESEFAYDDEGGYWRAQSVYPIGLDEVEDPYEIADEFSGFTFEALCLLCDVSTEEWEGSVTIAQARERSFA